jgi:hypothetical protein
VARECAPVPRSGRVADSEETGPDLEHHVASSDQVVVRKPSLSGVQPCAGRPGKPDRERLNGVASERTVRHGAHPDQTAQTPGMRQLASHDGRMGIRQGPGGNPRRLALLVPVEQSLLADDVALRFDARLSHGRHVFPERGQQRVSQIPARLFEVALRAEGDRGREVLPGLDDVLILLPREGLPLEVRVEQVLPHLGPDVLEQVPQPTEHREVPEDCMLALMAIEPVEPAEEHGGPEEHRQQQGEDQNADPVVHAGLLASATAALARPLLLEPRP